jgi:hypothetical protein
MPLRPALDTSRSRRRRHPPPIRAGALGGGGGDLLAVVGVAVHDGGQAVGARVAVVLRLRHLGAGLPARPILGARLGDHAAAARAQPSVVGRGHASPWTNFDACHSRFSKRCRTMSRTTPGPSPSYQMLQKYEARAAHPSQVQWQSKECSPTHSLHARSLLRESALPQWQHARRDCDARTVPYLLCVASGRLRGAGGGARAHLDGLPFMMALTQSLQVSVLPPGRGSSTQPVGAGPPSWTSSGLVPARSGKEAQEQWQSKWWSKTHSVHACSHGR